MRCPGMRPRAPRRRPHRLALRGRSAPPLLVAGPPLALVPRLASAGSWRSGPGACLRPRREPQEAADFTTERPAPIGPSSVMAATPPACSWFQEPWRLGGCNRDVPPRLVRVAAAVVLVLFVSAAGDARTKHRVIRVPRDAATLPAAIRLAAPGDLILLGRGVYRGAVVVPPTKRRITIRGVDRNRVVFDGHDERRTAILVHADGVTLENFSAHNYLGNALFWEGVKGFRASYLTIWNVGRYGIYVEGSADGVIDHDYISGAADAAYYVGECNPCHATLTHLVARLSAVGYSGTNASGGLVVRGS